MDVIKSGSPVRELELELVEDWIETRERFVQREINVKYCFVPRLFDCIAI